MKRRSIFSTSLCEIAIHQTRSSHIQCNFWFWEKVAVILHKVNTYSRIYSTSTKYLLVNTQINQHLQFFPTVLKCQTIAGAKGRLIWNCLFCVFNSSKKTNKKFLPDQARAKIRIFKFVFLEELKTPKCPFEIR